MSFMKDLHCAMVTSQARGGAWVSMGRDVGECRITTAVLPERVTRKTILLASKDGPMAVPEKYRTASGKLSVHGSPGEFKITAVASGFGLGLRFWDEPTAIKLADQLDSGPWDICHMDKGAKLACKALIVDDPNVAMYHREVA
jgi:hypothetical protein